MIYNNFGLTKKEAFTLWIWWRRIGLSSRRVVSLFNIFGKDYELYKIWAGKQQAIKERTKE